MTEENDVLKESSTIINEIENQLEKVLIKKKEEIEKELSEKIKLEKAEADKKVLQIEKELEKEKESLKEYRALISEFKTNKAGLQNQMKDHLNRAMQHQKEIEKLAGSTLEELRKAIEFSLKLEELRHGAEEKAFFLKKEIKEKFGIVPEVPESKEGEEIAVDLDQELAKLKKIKELLGSEAEVKLGAEVKPETEAKSETEMKPAIGEKIEEIKEEIKTPEPRKSDDFRSDIPGLDEVMEKSISAEEIPGEGEPQKEEKAEETTLIKANNFQTAFDILERYRKSDFNENNREISYFQKGNKILLDGECLIQSIYGILEEAKKLYLKLTQTETPKDQFFVKQELINHQEILRKLILRSVRMCEKDSCSLPKYTAIIINIGVLKDMLESLNMGNWSNQEDFASFNKNTVALKNAFYKKITPPAIYLKSMVEELQTE